MYVQVQQFSSKKKKWPHTIQEMGTKKKFSCSKSPISLYFLFIIPPPLKIPFPNSRRFSLPHHHIFAAIDLDLPILARAHDANFLVPAHGEDFDALAARRGRGGRFVDPVLDALPLDDEHAGPDAALVFVSAGSDIPHAARAVVAGAYEAVGGAWVRGEVDDGVGVAAEGHGGDGGGGGAGVDQGDVARGCPRREEV